MKNDVKAGIAVLLLAVVATPLLPLGDAHLTLWDGPPATAESIDEISAGLFDKWVLAFELLSLALLAALVAAVFMAKREPQESPPSAPNRATEGSEAPTDGTGGDG